MLKQLFILVLGGAALTAYADVDEQNSTSQNPQQAQTVTTVSYKPLKTSASAANATQKIANNPTVNSFAYSGAQFPQQNQLTGSTNQKYYSSQELKNKINNPNVGSFAYSGAQFPQQNQLTAAKNQKPSSSQAMQQRQNNPVINSRLYSGAQFPQQNNLNQASPNN